MSRPPFEVADIIRAYGNSFIEKNRSWLNWLVAGCRKVGSQAIEGYGSRRVTKALRRRAGRAGRSVRRRSAVHGAAWPRPSNRMGSSFHW